MVKKVCKKHTIELYCITPPFRGFFKVESDTHYKYVKNGTRECSASPMELN